jgi:hypothetical protein
MIDGPPAGGPSIVPRRSWTASGFGLRAPAIAVVDASRSPSLVSLVVDGGRGRAESACAGRSGAAPVKPVLHGVRKPRPRTAPARTIATDASGVSRCPAATVACRGEADHRRRALLRAQLGEAALGGRGIAGQRAQRSQRRSGDPPGPADAPATAARSMSRRRSNTRSPPAAINSTTASGSPRFRPPISRASVRAAARSPRSARHAARATGAP